MLKSTIEKAIQGFLYTPHSLKKSLIAWPLLVLSFFYKWVMAFRRKQQGLKFTNTCIIGVGNLTLGGSGKTPLVKLLVAHYETKKSMLVVSRGYKSQAAKTKQAIHVGNRQKLYSQALECGDEPFLIASQAQYADVWAGVKRLQTLKTALKTKPAQLVVLDDAFQNRDIHKDIELVLINIEDVLLEEHLLPYGPYREGFLALKDASALIVNRAFDTTQHAMIKKHLSQVYSGPIFFARTYLGGIKNTHTHQEFESLANKKVLAFAGIAKPENFFEDLKKEGVSISTCCAFSDHHEYSKKDCENLIELAKSQQLDCVLCTEKDWVKVQEHFAQFPLFCVTYNMAVFEEDLLMQVIDNKIKELL